MAQFIAFNKEVEVNKQTVMSVVNSMKVGMETRLEILKNNGIDPDKSEWFSQQDWLDAFREISDSLGDMNLFLIGKAIIDNAKFPPMDNLEQALGSLNIAYHMNHRLKGIVMFNGTNGEFTSGIGSYTLKSFDSEKRTAIFYCDNPYPSKFDEGIIMQVMRRFRPYNSINQEVNLDTTKESRTTGGDSCTYILKW